MSNSPALRVLTIPQWIAESGERPVSVYRLTFTDGTVSDRLVYSVDRAGALISTVPYVGRADGSDRPDADYDASAEIVSLDRISVIVSFLPSER